MNEMLFFASVVMPGLVILGALVAVKLHNRWLAKQPGYGPEDRKD